MTSPSQPRQVPLHPTLCPRLAPRSHASTCGSSPDDQAHGACSWDSTQQLEMLHDGAPISENKCRAGEGERKGEMKYPGMPPSQDPSDRGGAAGNGAQPTTWHMEKMWTEFRGSGTPQAEASSHHHHPSTRQESGGPLVKAMEGGGGQGTPPTQRSLPRGTAHSTAEQESPGGTWSQTNSPR